MAENSLQPTQTAEVVYKPSELIAIFNSILAQQNINARMVYLRGVYWKNPRQDAHWASCYDILKDEDSQEEITLKISNRQREELKDGNLVSVGGILTRQVSNKGFIQLVLSVSRIDVVKDVLVDETEIKKAELRQLKAKRGYKNVNGIIEQIFFNGERPKIAMVYASVSITDADVEAGKKAAPAVIDFEEFRVNFASPSEVCRMLKEIDAKGFTAIALIRGGGGGLEHLDDLNILETVVSLNTAIIAAVGHVEEKIFLKQVVDLEISTPNGLGTYFSDMAEEISQKKSKSIAAITEQVRKQFAEQIETANKQNKALQSQLTQLNKNSEESQKQHKTQIEEANKQNKALQERLDAMTKTMESSQKSHTEQLTTLQNQLKQQNENAEKARKEQMEADERKNKQFNESLTKQQDANLKLQQALNDANAKKTEIVSQMKELEAKLATAQTPSAPAWMWIVIVVLIIGIIFLLSR